MVCNPIHATGFLVELLPLEQKRMRTQCFQLSCWKVETFESDPISTNKGVTMRSRLIHDNSWFNLFNSFDFMKFWQNKTWFLVCILLSRGCLHSSPARQPSAPGFLVLEEMWWSPPPPQPTHRHGWWRWSQVFPWAETSPVTNRHVGSRVPQATNPRRGSTLQSWGLSPMEPPQRSGHFKT